MWTPADGSLTVTNSGSQSAGGSSGGPSATAMAASRCSLLLLLLAVALAAFSGFERVDAQADQPPLDPWCQGPSQELVPCLDFASGAAPSPSAQCCNGLQDVVELDDYECMCELLANPGQRKLNVTFGQELAVLCHLQPIWPVDWPSGCRINFGPAPPALPTFRPVPGGSSTARTSAIGSLLALAAVTFVAALL